MSRFSERIGNIESDYKFKLNRLAERKAEMEIYREEYKRYQDRLVAQEYITLLAEDSTRVIRDYLESIINRTLDAIFSKNRYRFELAMNAEKQQVELVLSEHVKGIWRQMDIKLQAGDGMGQVICLLYSVVLTEITGHRMFFLQDEVLGGLHEHAIIFLKKVLSEFARHGAQFAMIEYTVEDFGTQNNIVLEGDTSYVASVEEFGLS